MKCSYRVLVIGAGSIGHRHLRCFKATGRVTLLLCEQNADLARQVADLNGVETIFPNLDAALANPPDAAVIATPAPLHVPMAIRLAQVGIHLLIEKPLSTTMEGIDRLQAIFHARKLHAAVAYVHRANPALHAMKNAIASGRFGRPVQLVATSGSHFPSYRPAYRDIYYRERSMGGGAIQDALTHVTNAAEWLVGPIDRLVADAAHQVLDGVDVEDTVHLLARHDSVLGSYSLNQHQSPNELTITVVCEQGTVRWELHRHRWRWMIRPDEPWHDEQHQEISRDAVFIRQANAFLDVIEGTAPPLCSLEEGIQSLHVNLAAIISTEQNAWQTIQPKSLLRPTLLMNRFAANQASKLG